MYRRELDRIVAQWLEDDGPRIAPEHLVESVISGFPESRPRASVGFQWMALAGLAAAAILVAIVGLGFLAQNVGPPPVPPIATPSSTDRAAQACPPEVPACGGHLAAGVGYRTAAFEPGIAFTVPDDRWAAPIDEPGRFVLWIESDIRRRIGLYWDPIPIDPGGAPVRAVSRTPDGVIAWLSSHPEITVSDTGTTTLLGVEAQYADIQPSSAASTEANDLCLPTQAGFGCLPIFRTGDQGATAELGLGGSDRYRILLIDRSGTMIAVIVEAHHTSGIDALLERAAPILESLEFAP